MALFYRGYLDIELISVLGPGVGLSKQRQESMHNGLTAERDHLSIYVRKTLRANYEHVRSRVKPHVPIDLLRRRWWSEEEVL
jgi:hypothetical protein